MASRTTNEGNRRWVRHDTDVPVRIVVEGGERTPAIEGRCVKISDGGMCVFAVANLAAGTEINVDFVESPLKRPLRLGGTVRNCNVYLYGVEQRRPWPTVAEIGVPLANQKLQETAPANAPDPGHNGWISLDRRATIRTSTGSRARDEQTETVALDDAIRGT